MYDDLLQYFLKATTLDPGSQPMAQVSSVVGGDTNARPRRQGVVPVINNCPGSKSIVCSHRQFYLHMAKPYTDYRMNAKSRNFIVPTCLDLT
jgi:hypothetical protein